MKPVNCRLCGTTPRIKQEGAVTTYRCPLRGCLHGKKAYTPAEWQETNTN